MRAQMQAAKKKQEQEDPRARRRRLFKIISEEKPIFPVQKQNFHAMVMDNKEVMETIINIEHLYARIQAGNKYT